MIFNECAQYTQALAMSTIPSASAFINSLMKCLGITKLYSHILNTRHTITYFSTINFVLIAILCTLLYTMIFYIYYTCLFTNTKLTITANTTQRQSFLTIHQKSALLSINSIHFPSIPATVYSRERSSLNSSFADNDLFCSTSVIESTNILMQKAKTHPADFELFIFPQSFIPLLTALSSPMKFTRLNKIAQDQNKLNLHQLNTTPNIKPILQFKMHPMLPPNSSSHIQFNSYIAQAIPLKFIKQTNPNSSKPGKRQSFALFSYNNTDPLRKCVPMTLYYRPYPLSLYQSNQKFLLHLRQTIHSIVRDLRKKKGNQDITLNLGPKLPSYLQLLIECVHLCSSCRITAAPPNLHDSASLMLVMVVFPALQERKFNIQEISFIPAVNHDDSSRSIQTRTIFPSKALPGTQDQVIPSPNTRDIPAPPMLDAPAPHKLYISAPPMLKSVFLLGSKFIASGPSNPHVPVPSAADMPAPPMYKNSRTNVVRDPKYNQEIQDSLLKLGQPGIKARPTLPSYLQAISALPICRLSVPPTTLDTPALPKLFASAPPIMDPPTLSTRFWKVVALQRTPSFITFGPSNPHDPGPSAAVADNTVTALTHLAFFIIAIYALIDFLCTPPRSPSM